MYISNAGVASLEEEISFVERFFSIPSPIAIFLMGHVCNRTEINWLTDKNILVSSYLIQMVGFRPTSFIPKLATCRCFSTSDLSHQLTNLEIFIAICLKCFVNMYFNKNYPYFN